MGDAVVMESLPCFQDMFPCGIGEGFSQRGGRIGLKSQVMIELVSVLPIDFVVWVPDGDLSQRCVALVVVWVWNVAPGVLVLSADFLECWFVGLIRGFFAMKCILRTNGILDKRFGGTVEVAIGEVRRNRGVRRIDLRRVLAR